MSSQGMLSDRSSVENDGREFCVENTAGAPGATIMMSEALLPAVRETMTERKQFPLGPGVQCAGNVSCLKVVRQDIGRFKF